ncbi:hypothetical protein [uncultured Ornithinimicrobium sp.]|uniref:hypothetical protein n=1 Tax=uncultured Ornithinimicrobium sp. TaxID=259307 RepID=UPI002597A56F|nr:hypothetical protein [uncultured Ornithinimicrobium sp.]
MSSFLRTAEMTLRDLIGRRWVLVLLVLVPLVFYAARRGDAGWQSIRLACMGLAWALSTVALFSTLSARSLEPRLRIAGAAISSLLAGRVLALTAVAIVIGGAYALLVTLDQEVEHAWAIAAALLLSAVLSVPLGILIGRLIPREFEGMLLLITVVGLQTIVDPGSTLAQLLPLWATRELLSYGIEGHGDLNAAWTHAAAYGTAMLVVGFAITWSRLRSRPHMVTGPAAP